MIVWLAQFNALFQKNGMILLQKPMFLLMIMLAAFFGPIISTVVVDALLEAGQRRPYLADSDIDKSYSLSLPNDAVIFFAPNTAAETIIMNQLSSGLIKGFESEELLIEEYISSYDRLKLGTEVDFAAILFGRDPVTANASSKSYDIFRLDYESKEYTSTSMLIPALQFQVDRVLVASATNSDMSATVEWMVPLGEKNPQDSVLEGSDLTLLTLILAVLMPFFFLPLMNLPCKIIGEGIHFSVAHIYRKENKAPRPIAPHGTERICLFSCNLCMDVYPLYLCISCIMPWGIFL